MSIMIKPQEIPAFTLFQSLMNIIDDRYQQSILLLYYSEFCRSVCLHSNSENYDSSHLSLLGLFQLNSPKAGQIVYLIIILQRLQSFKSCVQVRVITILIKQTFFYKLIMIYPLKPSRDGCSLIKSSKQRIVRLQILLKLKFIGIG